MAARLEVLECALRKRLASGAKQLLLGAFRPRHSSAAKLFDELVVQDRRSKRHVRNRVSRLSVAEASALELYRFRQVHRCVAAQEIVEPQRELPPGGRELFLRSLCQEVCEGGAPLPGALAALPLRERVLLYSGVLAALPRDDAERKLVASFACSVLRSDELLLRLGCHQDWHHVLRALLRRYPDHTGPLLSDFLVRHAHALEAGACTEAAASECLKRIALGVLRRCSPLAHADVLRLEALVSQLALAELQGAGGRCELTQAPPTLPAVVVRSFCAAGWYDILRYWGEDAGAGDLLRHSHGVSLLLQCLEEPAVLLSGPSAAKAMGRWDVLVDLPDRQDAIFARFFRALRARRCRTPGLLCALGWSELDCNVWTTAAKRGAAEKPDPGRQRLADVLRTRAWSRKIPLPPLLQTPLAQPLPLRQGVGAVELVLPLPGSEALLPAPPPGMASPPDILRVPELPTEMRFDDRATRALQSAQRAAAPASPARWLQDALWASAPAWSLAPTTNGGEELQQAEPQQAELWTCCYGAPFAWGSADTQRVWEEEPVGANAFWGNSCLP